MHINNRPLVQRNGQERWFFEREFEIRAALKAVHPTNTFSVDGLKITQRRHSASLLEFGIDPTPNILHPNWNTPDPGPRAPFCCYGCNRRRAYQAKYC